MERSGSWVAQPWTTSKSGSHTYFGRDMTLPGCLLYFPDIFSDLCFPGGEGGIPKMGEGRGDPTNDEKMKVLRLGLPIEGKNVDFRKVCLVYLQAPNSILVKQTSKCLMLNSFSDGVRIFPSSPHWAWDRAVLYYGSRPWRQVG